jgi:hypothetical protein
MMGSMTRVRLAGIHLRTALAATIIAAASALLLLFGTPVASAAASLRALSNYVPAVVSCASDGSCTTAGSQWSEVNSVKSFRGQMTTSVNGDTTAVSSVQLPANAASANPYVGFGPYACDG